MDKLMSRFFMPYKYVFIFTLYIIYWLIKPFKYQSHINIYIWWFLRYLIVVFYNVSKIRKTTYTLMALIIVEVVEIVTI